MGKTSWTWYEPLGTILIISPWNYPFYQAIVPIACAVAAGNTVLYKPSEWTPLEGLVEDLLAEAQFAPNWVQVVYGDGAVGAALVEQRPDKIFFTGSTRTGRRILAQAAPHLIPVELELGGKDAMIVFDDVDHRARRRRRGLGRAHHHRAVVHVGRALLRAALDLRAVQGRAGAPGAPARAARSTATATPTSAR